MDSKDLEKIADILKNTVNEKFEAWRSGFTENITHRMSPETKIEFDELKVTLQRMEDCNCKQHEEIIEHQKHTNGDVTQLKLWQARVIGGMAVILACMGFVSTFYFIERGEQKESFNSVIEIRSELTALKDEFIRLRN